MPRDASQQSRIAPTSTNQVDSSKLLGIFSAQATQRSASALPVVKRAAVRWTQERRGLHMKRAAARVERARAAERSVEERNKLTSFLGNSHSSSRGGGAAAARARGALHSVERGAPRVKPRGGAEEVLRSDAIASSGAEWDVRVNLTPRHLHRTSTAATLRDGGAAGSSAAAAGGARATLHESAPSYGRTPSQLQDAAPQAALGMASDLAMEEGSARMFGGDISILPRPQSRRSSRSGRRSGAPRPGVIQRAERPLCEVQDYISSWGTFREEATNNNKLTSPGWFYKVVASDGGGSRAVERGPFTAARMTDLRRRGWIQDQTLVRRGDEKEWIQVERSEGVHGRTFL